VDRQHYFSFNKKSDWAKGSFINLDVSESGIAVNKTVKYGVHKTLLCSEIFRIMDITERADSESERPPEIFQLAAGSSSRLFLLDEHTNVWMFDPSNEYRELMFSAGHGLFSNQAMMAAGDQLLVIADPTVDRKIAAYYMKNGQCMWQADVWGYTELYPLALCMDALGSAYIVVPDQLEQKADGEWEIPAGSALNVMKVDRSGVMTKLCDSFLEWGVRTKLAHLKGRFSITCPTPDQPIVFDTKEQHIIHCHSSGHDLTSIQVPSAICSDFVTDSAGAMYIGDCRGMPIDEDDNRFLWRIESGDLEPTPISGFRGRCDKLTVDQSNRLYVLDTESSTITILQLKPRTLELEETGELKAYFLSKALDSTLTETRWHKLLLEADIPDETQVRISAFASDRKTFIIDDQSWDLDDFIVSEQIDGLRKLELLDRFWSKPLVNPQDALLFEAEGQYLWFKIEFLASESKSPFIHKLRVYYPRTSFLSYLPAVYQEEPKSSDFLERFLSLFSTFYLGLEDDIDRISRNFDVETVPPDFLKWLGTWMGIRDDWWTKEQLMQLIMRAPELYQLRGTKQGLAQLIALYTGELPIIVEYFEYKHMLDKPELKDLISRLYSTNPYSFSVMVRQEHLESEKRRYTLQQIIDENKPAFTDGKLIVLEPWMHMDMHTYLGINSILAEPSWQSFDNPSSTPFHTRLNDDEHNKQIGFHLRLELDSELE
jgi:phage tail-like protein